MKHASASPDKPRKTSVAKYTTSTGNLKFVTSGKLLHAFTFKLTEPIISFQSLIRKKNETHYSVYSFNAPNILVFQTLLKSNDFHSFSNIDSPNN